MSEWLEKLAQEVLDLVGQAVLCHSPSGAEAEIDAFLFEQVAKFGASLERDAAGNLALRIAGEDNSRRILITAHKDELGMLVKAVDGGAIYPERLNGATAWVYGEGPVEILGRNRTVLGILGFGSRHVSESSSFYPSQKTKVVDWSDARVETKLTATALADAGIDIGSRIVVARSRKALVRLPDDFVAGYALDNRISLAALLLLFRRLSLPRFETWLAFPSNEEIGGVGAAYLASQIRPTDTIALGILPLSDQCFVKDLHAPYLLSRDRDCVYDQRLNDEIRDAAMKARIHIGLSTLAEYGSGASVSKRYGHSPRAACLCLPTSNSRGFEVSSVRGVVCVVEALTAFLESARKKNGDQGDKAAV
jgi:putative aminopeptidase FrvX